MRGNRRWLEILFTTAYFFQFLDWVTWDGSQQTFRARTTANC
ncbi:hypothetical protein CYB_2355 [Synechococcus sp. JA-2-3B'a(2-13)]|nr:hypothetical protein CYB_2355 [Synechococcus sp. JA-2-3B'a(2-13)]